jgi:hypothetical protein
MARDFFRELEGDIRVKHDTIVVTYYNAPNPEFMKSHYENLPDKLAAEGVQLSYATYFGSNVSRFIGSPISRSPSTHWAKGNNINTQFVS